MYEVTDDKAEQYSEQTEVNPEANARAAKTTADGMPIGNTITPHIQSNQVDVDPEEGTAAAFDDNAVLTIVRDDMARAQAYLDENSWLAEWQYVDYVYQSPTYDRDSRSGSNRPVRISRFNVAKNRNTLSTQTKRAIFNGQTPFVLEPRGKIAQQPNAQDYIDAWTALLEQLCERADLEYNLGLVAECQGLQGTAIANPVWETREVIRRTRKAKAPPLEVEMPDGTKRTVHTLKSDAYEVKEEKVTESWPCFEYRRLGTTFYDPKWRTPNRPDLSADYRIDIDFVTFYDLQQMRNLTCYKGIPEDEKLKQFFLGQPQGDAQVESQTADSMSQNGSSVLHAEGANRQTSKDPFLKPIMKIAYWTQERVYEVVQFQSRYLVIRNETHGMGLHALGYTANWWNIDNAGYGIGIGRLNAGDQRMDQGVLNAALKMIAFPLSAPILYDRASGNAPTQNVVTDFGQFWGIDAPGGDVRKAFGFLEIPKVPEDAWRVYELAQRGGEQLVGADNSTMQGNLSEKGSTAMRTAAGVNRLGSKADESIASPLSNLEQMIRFFLMFLVDMVKLHMPMSEIREILSERFAADVIESLDGNLFFDARFSFKILAGQKLVAKAAIMQLIPFLLQLVQQPQLLEYLHQKGWTINFTAIEKLFMQMSELAGREDIFIPLTDEEKQQVQQMNPNAMKMQIAALLEKLKGQNKLAEIDAKTQGEIQRTVVEGSMKHVAGSVPLDLAEARYARNTDLGILQHGFDGGE